MNKFLIIILITGLTYSGYSQKSFPRYSIHLTTMDGNVLKGLLLNVGDSALTVYPGKRHDWKAHLDPVNFNYTQIQQIRLKRKNGSIKGMLIGGGLGLTAITATVLMNGGKDRSEIPGPAVFAMLPFGTAIGFAKGGKSFKRSNINGNFDVFTEFKNRFYAKQ